MTAAVGGHEPERAPVSRRALIAGVGGVAGAIALGGVPQASGANELVGPDDATQGSGVAGRAAGSPSLVVTPGIHYITYPQFAFLPNNFSIGRQVSSSGAYGASSNGYLIAPVSLEAGTQIVDFAVGACNSSGAPIEVRLEAYPIAGGVSTTVGTVTIPNGAAATVQTASASVAHTVGSSSVYDIACFTLASGATRVYSARLGFIPVGYGFTPITPTRVYDSRAGYPPGDVTKGQLTNGTRVIDLLHGLSLPLEPKGVLTNLTVVNTSASGFLSLYKNGIAWPGTSSVNWFVPNEVVANAAYTEIDANGSATAKVPVNASSDFAIDVVGYYG